MFMVIFSLAIVVATTLVYAGLTARLQHDGVSRRQMDVWAGVIGLSCALLILSGGAFVERPVITSDSQHRVQLSADATLIRRRWRPSLSVPRNVVQHVAQDAVIPYSAPVPDVPVLAPVVEEPSAAQPAMQRRETVERERFEPLVPVQRPIVTATPLAILRPESGVRMPVDRPALAATATPAPVLIAPPTATAMPPLAPIIPEAPPPTAPPPPPTPHCGNPSAIDLDFEIVSAEAHRDETGELVVRYDARLDNRSSFPVQLTNLRVLALNRTGGSEQYGVDVRPDLTLPAADALRFEGAVALRKNPGPFGRTEVCLTFVPETCGERLPPNQRILTRCRTVSGF